MSAIVHESMHPEFPKGKLIRGKFLEHYKEGLYWMEVILSNGVKRWVIAKKIGK